MTAYHRDPVRKARVLEELARHRALDEIIQGTYWRHGKGCAVGCLTHDPSGGHGQFPARWGIPVELAYLMDGLFELLPAETAPEWPSRVMEAIPVGADLSMVWSRWTLWMLRGLPEQSDAVRAVAELYRRRVAGDEPSTGDWWAARSAARSAAGSAESAWSAGSAESAWSAAREAWIESACDEMVRLLAASEARP